MFYLPENPQRQRTRSLIRAADLRERRKKGRGKPQLEWKRYLDHHVDSARQKHSSRHGQPFSPRGTVSSHDMIVYVHVYVRSYSYLGSDMSADCFTRPQYVDRSYREAGRSRLPGNEADMV